MVGGGVACAAAPSRFASEAIIEDLKAIDILAAEAEAKSAATDLADADDFAAMMIGPPLDKQAREGSMKQR